MSKTIAITSGLLLCLILEIHGSASWNANFTFSPNVVKVKDLLLVVGLQDNTVVVNSTFDGNQSNTCKHDFFNPDEKTFDQTEVTALGNGKIVINTVLTSRKEVRNGQHLRWRLLLILNPFDCSTLRKVELNDMNFRFEALVPYHDSFDVFLHNFKENGELKKPQRYNDQGEQLKLDHSFLVKGRYLIVNIQTIEPYNASKGYISYIRTDSKFVMKLLNSRFETVKEVVVKPVLPIDTWSVAEGKINFCYPERKMIKKENKHVFCQFLDAELKSKVLVDLVNPDGTNSVYKNIVTNLPDGGALVVVQYEDGLSNEGYNKMKLYVHHINADGSVRKPVNVLGQNPLFFRHSITNAIPLNNGSLCFINGGEFAPYENSNVHKNHVWIDCLEVSNF